MSLKHVYEIAKARERWQFAALHIMKRQSYTAGTWQQVKQSDPGSEFICLQSICTSIIGTARSMGVAVVR